jgi:hypothetical protein
MTYTHLGLISWRIIQIESQMLQRQQPGEITKGDSKITEATEGCEPAKLSMEVIKSAELGVEQARGGRRGLGGRSMAHAA